MTEDDIAKLAYRIGLATETHPGKLENAWMDGVNIRPHIIRFARAIEQQVRQAERSAAAGICIEAIQSIGPDFLVGKRARSVGINVCMNLAAKIQKQDQLDNPWMTPLADGERARMLQALAAARDTIESDRDNLVECHGGPDELEPIAQDGVADYDRVLKLIDGAMLPDSEGGETD